VNEDDAVTAAREIRVVFGRLRRRFREVADVDDLTPTQTSALSRLTKNGPASASELAAAERVRPQSIAATIAVLEERGLVGRRPDPGDGRRQLVSVTDAGMALVTGARQARDEWLAGELRAHFTDAERATILAALTLLDRLT
jgi:DNA-binding MarR family transcriptional regulator